MQTKKKMTDLDEIKKLSQARAANEPQKDVAGGEGGRNKKDGLYFMSNGYLCRKKTTRDGEVPIRICNFSAKITEESIVDNGLDQTAFYGIEGKLHGTKPLIKLEIPAMNFGGMTWVNRWGAGAVLEPGVTIKDFLRHAIQVGSQEIKKTTFFGHVGWREIDGKMVYLHAAGAIGLDAGVSVKLPPELQRYSLPPSPPAGAKQAHQIRKAAEAALAFLNIGKREVTLPLWSFVFLAPLTSLLSPQPNFSFFLHGQSGSYKSTLAVLALGFFGHFPGIEGLSNFDDTDGALEMRSFILKDALFCIDDLHPSSNRTAAQLREGHLQRIIRSFGNRTARGRLNADLSSKNRYPPRGLLIVTGEEQAQLESSIARICSVEITKDAILKSKLSAAQETAGLLPVAMSSYIQWIIANMDSIVSGFPAAFRDLRTRATGEGIHGRLPEQVAFLQFALSQAAAWLVTTGALSDTGAAELLSEGWAVFKSLSAAQQRRIGEDDPVAAFIEVIATLISQHNVRLMPVVEGGGLQIGAGEIIGFYDDEHIFLNPTGAWHSLQRFCILEGTHFPFSKNTFFHMLKNRGIIQPSATGEPSIAKKIGGKTHRVLKIIGGGLYEKLVTL